MIAHEVFSRGLRNSMALSVHPSGQVYQGENSLDLPDEDQPYEEINNLEFGKHYGWPYCHSQNKVLDVFQPVITPQMCAQNYKSPLIFMPAHVAPLSLLFYQGQKLNLQQKLLVSWHGYREQGHQIVAFPVDLEGRPTQNQGEAIIFDWQFMQGIRPLGAPVGLTELHDGSILVMDDKNSSVFRLSNGENWKNEDTPPPPPRTFTENQIALFDKLQPFLRKNCVLCHPAFREPTAAGVLQKMGHMLNMNKPEKSLFYMKLKSRSMPPATVRSSLRFQETEYEEINADLENFIQSLD